MVLVKIPLRWYTSSVVSSDTTPAERPHGLHALESTGATAEAGAASPEMERANKEFRIAEIRLEIAKLNFEKQQLRASLARP